MPQMSPINWLIIFILCLLCLMIMMFMMNTSLINYKIKNNFKPNYKKWKLQW
nr:TPA: ATP8 [Bombus confusus]